MNVARRCSIAVLLVIAIGLGGGLIAEASPPGAYGHLPLSFEANRGQTDPSVEFVARSAGYQFFLTEEEAVLVLRRPGAWAADTLRLTLVGAHPRRPVGVESLPGTVNYLVGSDPAAWRTAIPTYAKVRVPGVYPGVDLVYYGHGRQIEYDFIVGPGADPAAIRLSIRGLPRGPELDLSLRESGDLAIRVPGGDVLMKRPVAYQADDAGVRTPVEVAYVLLGSPDDGGRQVGFAIGPYNRDRRLVIDPVVSYATYLGGTLEDAGMAIAHRDGHVYVTGYTDSVNFPSPGGAQNNQLGQDAFVAKLDAAGTGLVYATYVGGSGEDAGVAIAVDAAGQAYVTGDTDSTNFPRVPTTPLFGDQGGRDAFVVKLNAAGTAFLYATYLGGGAEDHGLGIAVDAAGSAHVTGWTDSGDFPTTPSTAFQGDQLLRDAFVSQISPTGTALLYSTYLGGDGDDEAHAVAVDASGRIHVTGGSTSANLPRTANSRLPAGGQDAFVATFNPSAAGAASLTFLTYFGGSGEDAGRGIAVDLTGLIYFTGSTASQNFPTRAGTAYQSAPGGGEDAFVAKLNPAGLGPNQVMVYSSLLGGSGHEAGYGLALDEEGQVYITGFTTSSDFPTRDASDTQLGGSRDAFVAKFDTLGVGPPSLRYSTYLGGSGDDEGYGIAVDAAGHAYVAGLTRSGNFPDAVGTLSGLEDAFVARLSEPDLVISVLTAPVTAGDGGVIEVSAVTRNTGAVEAGRSTTRIYLSPDNRLNPSLDTLLGSYEVPELAAGQEHALDPPLTVTLPTGLPPATYFLFASADDADAIGESFESNNKTKRELMIGPDLTVSSLSVSTFGATMTVTDVTRNVGGAPVSVATTTRFFLVTASGDVSLGSRAVGALGAGAATEPTETSFPIPPGTLAGSYTVVARADVDNAVVETSESNNGRPAPFDLGVDLIVATLGEVPSTAGAGKSFVVRTTITNLGFIRSLPSTAEFFLSTTQEFGPTAVSIGTRATPALDPGQESTTLSATLAIPAATAPGSYFLVAKANGGPSPIAETRTTNNTRARATVIGPDLVVTFVSPSTVTAGPGGTFTFKETTRNLGGGVAAASVTKFYLSPDAVYDATDVELGQRAVRALDPREQDFNSLGVPLPVPQSTAAGTHFVIVRANAGPTPIGETDPANNTLTASLNLAAIDLVVSSRGPGPSPSIPDVATRP